jgi:hypothetical protein
VIVIAHFKLLYHVLKWLFSLGLLAGGVYLALEPAVSDEWRLVGFGLTIPGLVFSVVTSVRLFRSSWAVAVTREGIIDRSSWHSPGLIPWSDIHDIRVVVRFMTFTHKPDAYDVVERGMDFSPVEEHMAFDDAGIDVFQSVIERAGWKAWLWPKENRAVIIKTWPLDVNAHRIVNQLKDHWKNPEKRPR